MKKFLAIDFLFVFFALCSFTFGASAQSTQKITSAQIAYAHYSAFNEGDMVINAGVGLGTFIYDRDFSVILPPITASFEYGIVDLFEGQGGIGIGGYAGYLLRKNDVFGNVGDLVVGPRGLFHYQFVDNLDTYTGIMLGYDIRSFSQKNTPLSGSTFAFAYFVGARYYFTNHFGAFAELGYGISPVQLGFTFKF